MRDDEVTGEHEIALKGLDKKISQEILLAASPISWVDLVEPNCSTSTIESCVVFWIFRLAITDSALLPRLLVYWDVDFLCLDGGTGPCPGTMAFYLSLNPE